ncbi:MAG: hypothetical protein JNM70_17830, partial [Anaerolineae bacterium]|nr:hypothetical protein [Anaerolineae bacterium]
MPRRIGWIMAALMAAVSGVIGAVLLRRRPAAPIANGTLAETQPIPTGAPMAETKKTEQAQPAALPSPTRAWRIETILVMALAGLACLIVAQQSMLQSRWPVTPLALYLVGISLLLPLMGWVGDQRAESSPLRQGNSGSDVQKPAGIGLSPYWIAGTFFLIVAALMGLLSPGSLLFGAGWLLGAGCFIMAGLRLNGRAMAQGWMA